jgi:hypothetical protein
VRHSPPGSGGVTPRSRCRRCERVAEPKVRIGSPPAESLSLTQRPENRRATQPPARRKLGRPLPGEGGRRPDQRGGEPVPSQGGPTVRIRFPPGESPQTIGSAGDFTGSRSPRRSSGSARRSRASMRSARSSPASSGSWRRLSVCWHATSKAGRQKRRFQPGPRPPQRRRLLQRGSAAHYARDTSWWQARLADPRRAGPCVGRRQDAAGNHGCMQGARPNHVGGPRISRSRSPSPFGQGPAPRPHRGRGIALHINQKRLPRRPALRPTQGRSRPARQVLADRVRTPLRHPGQNAAPEL